MEFLGALALYYLFKYLYRYWEEKNQSKGEQYVHPDDLHAPEMEFKCGTKKKCRM
jgi:hypothetical protein